MLYYLILFGHIITIHNHRKNEHLTDTRCIDDGSDQCVVNLSVLLVIVNLFFVTVLVHFVTTLLVIINYLTYYYLIRLILSNSIGTYTFSLMSAFLIPSLGI